MRESAGLLDGGAAGKERESGTAGWWGCWLGGRERDGWMVALLVGIERDGWMVVLLVERERDG